MCVSMRVCVLEKLLALRKVLIDGPQIIPLPSGPSCSLNLKRFGNFSQPLKGPEYSKALNTYQCYQSGGKKGPKI